MQHWMVVDLPSLFGAAQRPKPHRLSAHVLDEFSLRGNLTDGDTGLNEALHKSIKRAGNRTNKRGKDNALQLIMAEQVASFVESGLDSSAYRQRAIYTAERAPVGSARASRSGAKSDGEDAPTARASGRRVVVRDLAAELGIPELPDVLQETVSVRQAAYVLGSPLRHDGRRPVVRASSAFLEAPQYSWGLYCGTPGGPHYGRCRAVLSSVGESIHASVVIERVRASQPETDCPFTAYGCQKLQWDVRPGTGPPVCAMIPMQSMVKVLCVENDLEDFVKRHGLKPMPVCVPTNADEVRRRRFFTNAFVCD